MKVIALLVTTVLATSMAYGQAAPTPPASAAATSSAPSTPPDINVPFPAGADSKLHDLYQQYVIITQRVELAKSQLEKQVKESQEKLEKQAADQLTPLTEQVQAAFVEFKKTNKLGDDVNYNPETRTATKKAASTPATSPAQK